MATNEQIIKEMKDVLNITEQVHTYQRWQELGKQVQKGSKALFTCKIWRQCKGKKNFETVVQVDEATTIQEEGKPNQRMFLVKASFFGASQVKPIKQIDDGSTIDIEAVEVKQAAALLEEPESKQAAEIDLFAMV